MEAMKGRCPDITLYFHMLGDYLEVLMRVMTAAATVTPMCRAVPLNRTLCQPLSLDYLISSSQETCVASNIILILHVRKGRPESLRN